MEALLSDIDVSKLDQLDLSQSATVIWDGPTQRMSSLSNAVTYVVESISDAQFMEPLVAISEEPFLLEMPQVRYVYEQLLSAARNDEIDIDDALNGEA